MSVIYAPEERKVNLRTLVVPLVLLVATVAFVIRLWYWQVVKHEEYKEMASRAGRMTDETLAPRGRIYDRKGVLLADVGPRIVVTAKPSIVQKSPEVLERVAEILQVPVKSLENAVFQQRHKGNLDVPIHVGATLVKAAQIAEMKSELPGIDVDTQPMRHYLDSTHFSHILGWVSVPNEVTEARLKEAGVKPARYVGRDGIESVYETRLMGEPGKKKFAVDLQRRPIRSLGTENPMPGDGLVLSLDRDLQILGHQLLAGRKGAIVALDPTNGEVLCMVGQPTYDLNVFDGKLTFEEADYLYQNPDRPMLKRPIAGLYPPGSTAKIVTTIAAAQAGKLETLPSIHCPGYLQVGNRRVRCDNHRAGTMGFNEAFAKSCNSFFGKLAQNTGAENMRKGMRACGFGQAPLIDINGASAGIVPSDEYVLERHKRPWSLGDTNNIGIGQGDFLVTPLQMANVAALVANRGTVYKPHVVRAFQNPLAEDGAVEIVQREVMLEVDLSPAVWTKLQGAMVNVVSGGTARRAQVEGIQVTGKTGSAENAARKTHAWFVGYAPAENPKIAFAVVIEAIGHGGEFAAPVAQQIVERYLFPERFVSSTAIAQN